jgi:hypothetical protein
MSEHDQTDQNQVQDFFDKPNNIKWLLRVFYFICVLLVALDFIVHRHIYLDFEKIPTFYALYGFVACVVLVLLAKIMRLMLMRSETYYEPSNSDDNSESGNNGRLD